MKSVSNSSILATLRVFSKFCNGLEVQSFELANRVAVFCSGHRAALFKMMADAAFPNHFQV